MIYRICGGIGLALLGLSIIGVKGIPDLVTGIFLLVAGIALLAGK